MQSLQKFIKPIKLTIFSNSMTIFKPNFPAKFMKPINSEIKPTTNPTLPCHEIGEVISGNPNPCRLLDEPVVLPLKIFWTDKKMKKIRRLWWRWAVYVLLLGTVDRNLYLSLWQHFYGCLWIGFRKRKLFGGWGCLDFFIVWCRVQLVKRLFADFNMKGFSLVSAFKFVFYFSLT